MRHPEWLKVRTSGTHKTKSVLRHYGLSTVCEEARCPNQGRCFSKNTVTFMILGDRCTRNCSFCAVEHAAPFYPDLDEPERVAEASRSLGLRYVVITSVTRDDLPDGGAGQFALTIEALRKKNPGIKVEVLTPDFRGDVFALKTVLDAGPDVFNHNIETVPRLYPAVRPQSDYRRSLDVLKIAKTLYPHIKTKSGFMLGLGEREHEVISMMEDLSAEADCDFLTIGQYLRPRKANIPVVEYVKPETFERYKNIALKMGFKTVASSPLVRSSMDAGELFVSPRGRV
ncbi:MAG: lipoyl synthase [Nitrospirae bacterium]|nr:lipoyl synthase [Nitrospirota bacterium]